MRRKVAFVWLSMSARERANAVCGLLIVVGIGLYNWKLAVIAAGVLGLIDSLSGTTARKRRRGG